MQRSAISACQTRTWNLPDFRRHTYFHAVVQAAASRIMLNLL